MNWEPARTDHAIDRVIASIVLAEAIDPNTFDEVVVAGRKAAARHHLTDRIDLGDPLELPASEGAVIDLATLAPARRVVFRRLETGGAPVEELSLSRQRVTFLTFRYRRWVDFFDLINTTIASLDPYPISERTRVVRLEYIDRFQSVPPVADHFEVISRDSKFLAPIVKDKRAALHVHSGWFDFETPTIRKLTNVNIDVLDHSIPPPPDPRRKITVLTMGQLEALAGMLDRPIERLQSLHRYLKETFRSIITAEAAIRVGLRD